MRATVSSDRIAAPPLDVPPSADFVARSDSGIDFEAGRRFRSFQPVREQPLTEIANADWPQTRVDSFVMAAMQREGLTPAPRAERAVLIRRLNFASTGLPPTPERLAGSVGDEYRHAGRDFRLKDVHGRVVHDIIS